MSITCDDVWCNQEPGTKELGDSRKKQIETEVCDRLKRHDSFRGHWDSLTVEVVDGVLILAGRLPSFHLKQVLQTTMKNVPGVIRIVNRVDVVSARGLSSVTTHRQETDQ